MQPGVRARRGRRRPVVQSSRVVTGVECGDVDADGQQGHVEVVHRCEPGDIDADGRMELLVTPGTGGRPLLDAYTVNGGLLFRYRLAPIELP